MRYCPHCNVMIGGDGPECPLCQSPLLGEGDMEYWPKPSHLQRVSLLKKIIQFVLLSLGTVVLAMDFLIVDTDHKHIGLLLIMSTAMAYILVMQFSKRRRNVPRIILETSFAAMCNIFIYGWYLDFMPVAVNYVLPILCSATLGVNFIFSFIDTSVTENSLVYILLNIVVGVAPYIAIFISGRAPLAWNITLIFSIITFFGLVVFKGNKVFEEVRKRLHM